MKRKIDSILKSWKKTEDRKVLLVRGARQVGKTYSVRQLGNEFEHFLAEKIIPIEIKAGTRGQMQSMFIFLEERGLSTGIRISHEHFASYHKILTVPIYVVENIIEGRIQI